MTTPVRDPAALREQFLCPLSFELLRDPVRDRCMGATGHVYEREWIQEWLAEHSTCPMSRMPLRLEDLIELPAVRAACALLDPARVDPLTREDWEVMERAQEIVGHDPVVRVPQEIHNLISRKLRQMAVASREATRACFRC